MKLFEKCHHQVKRKYFLSYHRNINQPISDKRSTKLTQLARDKRSKELNENKIFLPKNAPLHWSSDKTKSINIGKFVKNNAQLNQIEPAVSAISDGWEIDYEDVVVACVCLSKLSLPAFSVYNLRSRAYGIPTSLVKLWRWEKLWKTHFNMTQTRSLWNEFLRLPMTSFVRIYCKYVIHIGCNG